MHEILQKKKNITEVDSLHHIQKKKILKQQPKKKKREKRNIHLKLRSH